MTGDRRNVRRRVAWAGSLAVFVTYAAIALGRGFSELAEDFHADESTYYLMGQSLASDGDLEYRRADLERGLALFPRREDGRPRSPNGLFLKKGVDVTQVRLTLSPPFVRVEGVPDPDEDRLYFGKALVYPLVAAPFVRVFGANGFLLLNAALLAACFAAAFMFTSARSPVAVSAIVSSAFIFASVMPVYWAWIAPELFNCALGLLAYFLWLYKAVAPDPPSPGWAWLRRRWTDAVAAVLIGVLTYSKVSNVLLLAPLGVWLLWRRQWRQLAMTGVVWLAVTAGLFGANVATSGEVSYQGGLDRRTCYDTFPFSAPGVGLEACQPRARNEALGDIIFDRQAFWTNFSANVGYFLTGRSGGVVAYYFPLVFAAAAFMLSRRGRQSWQWLVLAGLVAQALLFIVTLPYSYLGSGGSVGNRYFMGVYGTAVFLLPPIRSVVAAAVPWAVGGLFTLALVLRPFEASIRPASRLKQAPINWLPFELTQINETPIMTDDPRRLRRWFGERDGLLGFQIYHLDDNTYLQEADQVSFWVRGESRGEILIKADEQGGKPFRFLRLTFTAGPVATGASLEVAGRAARIALAPGETGTIQIALPPGFPYKGHRERSSDPPSMVWVVTLGSTAGFVPEPAGSAPDLRFLGVRARPHLIQ